MMMVVYDSPEDYLNELVERYSDDHMSAKAVDQINSVAVQCPSHLLHRYEFHSIYHDLPEWAKIFYEERINRVDLSELAEIS